jgi:hypothetical protein
VLEPGRHLDLAPHALDVGDEPAGLHHPGDVVGGECEIGRPSESSIVTIGASLQKSACLYNYLFLLSLNIFNETRPT